MKDQKTAVVRENKPVSIFKKTADFMGRACPTQGL
ncbi:hypothetical protein X474_11980 [Dethiosulfatarculus sandiegensis]|uniref:Uncharacterized protein n=1 Tax=Dethiosulfatarculus sandiegensis TaxID=1429043 RepID=A0A0D2JWD5_9BACT|nr:hypothetical protein X474_11980 [Dethiosulfatarculus sandiegensis]